MYRQARSSFVYICEFELQQCFCTWIFIDNGRHCERNVLFCTNYTTMCWQYNRDPMISCAWLNYFHSLYTRKISCKWISVGLSLAYLHQDFYSIDFEMLNKYKRNWSRYNTSFVWCYLRFIADFHYYHLFSR